MAGRQRLTGHEDIKGFNKRRMELWEKQEEQTIMLNTNCGKICIKIPARKLMPVSNSQIVRISAEAYNDLVEIYNQSILSMSEIASEIITQASNGRLIQLEKED